MIDSPFDGWSIEEDLGPARWFADALAPPDWGDQFRVHSIVPASYPAIARLVHTSEACIDAVLADAHLECYRTSAEALVYPRPYLRT